MAKGKLPPGLFRHLIALILTTGFVSALGVWTWAGMIVRGQPYSLALSDQVGIDFFYKLAPFLILAIAAWLLRKSQTYFSVGWIGCGLALVFVFSVRCAFAVQNDLQNKHWTAASLDFFSGLLFQLAISIAFGFLGCAVYYMTAARRGKL